MRTIRVVVALVVFGLARAASAQSASCDSGSLRDVADTARLNIIDAVDGAGTLDAWQEHQVYIALGKFMASAAVLGVDTCPMEGIEPQKFDELLGLADRSYATAVACAAGYRSPDDKYATMKKVRFKLEDVVVRI